MNTLWQKEEFEHICSRKSLLEKTAEIEKNDLCEWSRKGTPWFRPNNVLWIFFLESDAGWHSAGFDNGIGGGFMKTLYFFGKQSCQIFNGLKRCASKNAVLRCNKKTGKSGSVAPKCKLAETPHRFDYHLTKISPNPNILAYSKSP